MVVHKWVEFYAIIFQQKLDAIKKLKEQQAQGKLLEINQLAKIKGEADLIKELQQLQVWSYTWKFIHFYCWFSYNKLYFDDFQICVYNYLEKGTRFESKTFHLINWILIWFISFYLRFGLWEKILYFQRFFIILIKVYFIYWRVIKHNWTENFFIKFRTCISKNFSIHFHSLFIKLNIKLII